MWDVAWDAWDHRNQMKNNIETTQDLARSEMASYLLFGLNLLSVDPASHAVIGASLSALLCFFLRAHCIISMLGFSKSRLCTPGRLKERLVSLIAP
jgi:hypothetical protein